MIITSAADVGFELGDLATQKLPGTTLMVTPQHYQVDYVINPHMDGNVGTVDRSRARSQWLDLRTSYSDLGLAVTTLEGSAGYPDMVFCANQTLPGLDKSGRRTAVLSKMASDERSGEVDLVGEHLASVGHRIVALKTDTALEGCGDVLWHHDLRLLWCGYGFRSSPEAIKEACTVFGVPGIALELRDHAFYHLDTCLSILDRTTALWVPSAFAPRSAVLIELLIPNLIEVPRDEAEDLLACNAHSPDGRHVLIQSGCVTTNRRLLAAGFDVVEVETGEFLKAGGSVFCMKQMVW